MFVSHSIKSRFLRNDSSMHFPMHRICGTPPRTAVPFRFVDDSSSVLVPPATGGLDRNVNRLYSRLNATGGAETDPFSFVIICVQWQPVGFVDRVCNLLSCFARSPAVVSMSRSLSTPHPSHFRTARPAALRSLPGGNYHPAKRIRFSRLTPRGGC